MKRPRKKNRNCVRQINVCAGVCVYVHPENLIDLIIKEDNKFLMSTNFSMPTTKLIPFDIKLYSLYFRSNAQRIWHSQNRNTYTLTVYDKIKDQYDWHLRDECWKVNESRNRIHQRQPICHTYTLYNGAHINIKTQRALLHWDVVAAILLYSVRLEVCDTFGSNTLIHNIFWRLL